MVVAGTPVHELLMEYLKHSLECIISFVYNFVIFNCLCIYLFQTTPDETTGTDDGRVRTDWCYMTIIYNVYDIIISDMKHLLFGII